MRRERGQAITLNYTLGIAIATLLVTGLLIAGSGFVSDQRERATRIELKVIGQQLASDIEATDRLVVAGERNTSVRYTRKIPPNVAGSTYYVAVVAQPDPYLRLETEDPEVTIRVEFANQTAVAASEITGGRAIVNYTAAGRLRLEGGGS